MSTQTLYKENRQPEPQKILVERIPVREREKLPNKRIESTQTYSWEDFRGLSLGFEEDWN
ncbi:hypothetical protein [Candidatus Nitrosopumilus sediminis]|uniref:hypothetical protein n=1 Tax=Candidatus Nitrosopumilus sediminis TaxID=1229909 RepID=UPI000365068A|nr:hypothetical protein [Candidatus Nitrosopumilus sediminis]